jgi:hypothetical protein
MVYDNMAEAVIALPWIGSSLFFNWPTSTVVIIALDQTVIV